jgi:hypothetical protein
MPLNADTDDPARRVGVDLATWRVLLPERVPPVVAAAGHGCFSPNLTGVKILERPVGNSSRHPLTKEMDRAWRRDG